MITLSSPGGPSALPTRVAIPLAAPHGVLGGHMPDFFEIDFLEVHASCSGDAITIRYEIDGVQSIHVVDGGYVSTGDALAAHIRKYYGEDPYIDHVVVTHSDGDHAGGLRTVLSEFDVGTLWMLMPWDYADELIPHFSTYNSAQRLRARLRSIYSSLAELEDIAIERGIDIATPFQGENIGAFTVVAPSRESYLQRIVESEKTPETAKAGLLDEAEAMLAKAWKALANFVKARWGEETFSTNETSAENEMSVVQYAYLNGKKILLTGDAGRKALREAIEYAAAVLPGLDYFQVPHHGSRRNVNTELLDALLGERLDAEPEPGKGSFTAIISAAVEDEDHPRKAVVRALRHRGARVLSTDDGKGTKRISKDAPDRGWIPAIPLAYPTDQEA
jgi:beta-lactamase superfamily II metal-dependent hydrolase